MRSIWFRICRLAPALALLALLAGCGNATVAEGQVGSVSQPRPNQASGLDKNLLGQVDQALAAKQAAAADLAAAQALRDSAVSLDQQGRYEEANGNLKSAASLLRVLRGGVAAAALPAFPAAPAAPAAPADAQGATVVNATFAGADALKSWQRVGPKIPIGDPEWAAADGLLTQRGVAGAESVDEQTGLVTGDPSWQDVTIRSAVLVRSTKEVGLIVRQSGDSYYRFRALALGTGTNSGNLVLEKVIDGKVTQIATFDGPELSADVWHTLALSARGTTITCFVDGQAVGSAQDGSLSSGRAGVSTLAMSGAFFTNVQIIGR